MSPEISGTLIEGLLAGGALEAYLTPVNMKKNRPGFLLTVLVDPTNLTAAQDFIFRETTSFGLRMSDRTRMILDRHFENVSTQFGDISLKVGSLSGVIVQRSPEFESCRAAAQKAGVSIREVFAAAITATAKIV